MLLDKSIKNEIDKLIESAKLENKNGDLNKAIEYLFTGWKLLPEPKGLYDDSYHIVKYIVQLYLKLNLLNEAKEWILKIYECDKERADSGEREYLHGKIEHMLGFVDRAKELFQVAYKKSEGRYPNEPQYLNLIYK